jgi:hypothetical protein
MKYLILLLLTPLLIAETKEEAWEEYIKNKAGELTYLVCRSTGTETKSIGTELMNAPISSTDYYMFNKDHVIARLEIGSYKTTGLLIGEVLAPMWMINNNDQVISGNFRADQEALNSLNDNEFRYKEFTTSFVINRLTGFYTKKMKTIKLMYEFGEDYTLNAPETGKCEAYDPNVKKF